MQKRFGKVSVLRVARFLLAGFFLYDGMKEASIFMLLIGILLAWQAFTNAGCGFYGTACPVESKRP